ncbi:Ribokinase-like protein [Bombardia bombarda]|uniref:Ribokinase-like protein n=1 Tax=Bombardia bombarda TaxID=252184 RepID=A0AA39WGG5_9PEZI|nr:Ribokinase-like protein [Bombardia bombarda]
MEEIWTNQQPSADRGCPRTIFFGLMASQHSARSAARANATWELSTEAYPGPQTCLTTALRPATPFAWSYNMDHTYQAEGNHDMKGPTRFNPLRHLKHRQSEDGYAPVSTTSERPLHPLAFVSLGLVQLDAIKHPGSLHDVLGGSAVNSVAGARIVAGEQQSNRIGLLAVVGGHDFSDHARNTLKTWKTTLKMAETKDHETTRARIDHSLCSADEAAKDPQFLGASSFHIFGSPRRLYNQVKDLTALREATLQPPFGQKPFIVWELDAADAQPLDMDDIRKACRFVDIFSLNDVDLARLFTASSSNPNQDCTNVPEFDRRSLEKNAESLVNKPQGIGRDHSGVLVVRAGEHGCFIAQRHHHPKTLWLPAFHDPGHAVVDVTGAGSVFLGALTFAMAELHKNIVDAAKTAIVAASFAVEQVGPPVLSSGVGASEELWNCASFHRRLDIYERKIKARVNLMPEFLGPLY